MSEVQTIKRIENHRDSLMWLPPTPSFPNGMKLIPGLNTVPVLYLDELMERELVVADRVVNGRKLNGGTRKPAERMLANLQKHVFITDVNGSRKFGPQITIYDDIMSDRQDGPPPPPALPSNKVHAKKIIEVTTERAALKRWSEQGRGDIPDMARERLRELEERARG